MNKRFIYALAARAVFVGACGGSSDGANDSSTPDDVTSTPDDVQESAQQSAEEFADEVVDELEAVQAAEGGGGATLTANGQTWEFPSVLCAFGEDQTGQEGSIFNLSAIADGLQLYVSIDDSGASHSLSLDDITDFENPSVSLSVDPFTAAAAGASEDFLTLDGKSVSADVVMIDGITGMPTAEPAQLTATCP